MDFDLHLVTALLLFAWCFIKFARHLKALRRTRRYLNMRDARYYRMKADQEWDMAGLARQDRDPADEKKHTDKAREYEQLWREMMEASKHG